VGEPGAEPQRVVVTGAARGIGRAIAERFLRDGARVVVNDLDATVEPPAGAHAVPGDAATEAGVAELVRAATDQLGGIDVFVANAGVERGRGVEASEDDWAVSLEVNVLAHVRAARLLVPGWAERGHGRFVVTASAAGLLTALGSPAYAVSKHGAVAFAEWLAATYRHRGVHVHALCPQGVRTRMLEGTDELGALLRRDALEPEQVADALMVAIEEDRFLVLPHPEVAGYYANRAGDTDTWLDGMNRLQQKLERGSLT
jgi:NAD(P)-dependent dehydrogenase (short-subunit alcohol dehydrogenase family)